MVSSLPLFNASQFHTRTWAWLRNPGESKYFAEALADFRKAVLENKLNEVSILEHLSITNSLRWLSLLDPASSKLIDKFILNLSPPVLIARGSTHLRNESALLRSLEAFNKKENKSPSRVLSLKKEIDRSKDKKFLSSLSKMLGPFTLDRQTSLLIDMNSFHILAPHQRMISPPICKIFEYLRRQETASFAELLRIAYEIPRYESEIHQSKIHNLLSKARLVLPRELSFITRSEQAYARGVWERVRIIEENRWKSFLRSSAEWRKVLEAVSIPLPYSVRRNKQMIPLKQLQEFVEGRESITRQDLEKTFSFSRSTANRAICRWVRDKVLQKEGRGRKTYYIFLPRFY
jgi:hypothetical protein